MAPQFVKKMHRHPGYVVLFNCFFLPFKSAGAKTPTGVMKIAIYGRVKRDDSNVILETLG